MLLRMWKREPSQNADENVNWSRHNLGIYPKEMKTRYWRDICNPIFIAVLFIRTKDMEATQETINRWMNKDVVCIHIQWEIAVVVQSLSCVRLFETPWTVPYQALLSFNSRSLLKFVSFELVILSNHLIFCCLLLLLPPVFPSISVFSKESALPIRWPRYWSISLSNSLSNEYSGLIFFQIDWFDILAVQETLKHLLQHHSLKAFILWCSALMVQFSLTSVHDYRKNHSFNCTHLCLLWSPQSKAFT